MDIVQLLGSINKLSLLAFLIVLLFMVYELYLIGKEKQKKQKPTIPQFNPNLKVEGAAAENLHKGDQDETHASSNRNQLVFIVLFIILIFLGVITFSGIFQSSSEEAKSAVVVNEINSKGVKLFDKDWQEVDSRKSLQPGENVFIGVETIDNVGIDRARIRVNDNQWRLEDITTQFNNQKKIWYKEYKVATGEEKLKIDAQLHSRQDGWLGD